MIDQKWSKNSAQQQALTFLKICSLFDCGQSGAATRMESWPENLLIEIRKKRKKAAFWGNIYEVLSYGGLTISAACSSVAALSIVSKYSVDHPYASAALAFIPAIWIGIEKGLNPRAFSTYNNEVETNLHIMETNIAYSAEIDRETTINDYKEFLKTEQYAFKEFMKSFGSPIVAQKPEEKAKV